MYSVWTRANALLFTSLTVMAVMCTLTTLTTFWHEDAPVVRKLAVHKVDSLRNYRDRMDRATLSFDLDADLSSVFNWNVKQLFVYVVAEYASKSNAVNQVVIWDKIVRTPDVARELQFENERVEYFLSDERDELRGANVTLRLEWDIMPVCGRLFVHTQGRSSFVLPDKYMGKAPGRY
ncbi:hypothetical protein Poli38472_009723 [Pythium oligandrum]|uniref:Signal peptidase complex subunit 3 n=1 Tax=Pythium oligandrum TaxID=41045 RepID=A0A8K1CFF8_PYTOL|nr:hypothetical protein Poli38472_009723 [Pythium oligandrum]|eukprot:TMW62230.1 hypothetical protein Poli38472_009723 [Pythium oligandrum]